MYKQLLSKSFLFSFFIVTSIAANNILLIDTTGNSNAKYKPLTHIAKSLHSTIKYYGLTDLVNYSVPALNPNDVTFIMLSTDLMRYLNQPNNQEADFVWQRVVMDSLRSIATQSKTIVYAFPNGTTEQFLRLLLYGYTQKAPTLLEEKRISIAQRFLNKPFVTRSKLYETIFNKPSEQGYTFNIPTHQLAAAQVKLFPHQASDLDYRIKCFFPSSIGWYDNYKHQQIMLTFSPLFTLFGLEDSLSISPVDQDVAYSLFALIYEFVRESLPANQRKQYPITRGKRKVHIQKRIRSAHDFFEPAGSNPMPCIDPSSYKKTAWMDLDIKLFTSTNRSDIERAESFINMIVAARFDALWLTISPNMYYSPLAFRDEDEKVLLLQALKKFIGLLQNKSLTSRAPLPKILIGMEIMNNLYERDNNVPVPNPAKDIYGRTYDDVPSPLDKYFWESEVIIPWRHFVADWNKHVSKDIPIGGITITLQLYCRKRENHIKRGTISRVYSDTMGFSPKLIEKYNRLQFCQQDLRSVKDLILSNQLSLYQLFLDAKAYNIGKKLYHEIIQITPEAKINVYLPNIRLDWFNFSFMQGLSFDQTIGLFSLNPYHQKWVQQYLNINKCYINHYSEVLLSKFDGSGRGIEQLIDRQKRFNGVWLGRVSRLAEDDDGKSWKAPERTPLTRQENIDLMDNIGRL